MLIGELIHLHRNSPHDKPENRTLALGSTSPICPLSVFRHIHEASARPPNHPFRPRFLLPLVNHPILCQYPPERDFHKKTLTLETYNKGIEQTRQPTGVASLLNYSIAQLIPKRYAQRY